MSVRRRVVRWLGLVMALGIGVSVLGATAPSGAAPPSDSQPTEVNVTKDLPHRYGEPEIAVNPKNPKNLVYAVLTMGTTYACQKAKGPGCQETDTAYGPQPAGLIDNVANFSTVRVYVSFDAGKTWKRSTDVRLVAHGHGALAETGDPLLTAGLMGRSISAGTPSASLSQHDHCRRRYRDEQVDQRRPHLEHAGALRHPSRSPLLRRRRVDGDDLRGELGMARDKLEG